MNVLSFLLKFRTINDSILKLKIHSQVTCIKFSLSCSIIIVKLRDNVSGHFISSTKQARRNEVEVRCFNQQCIRRYFKEYPCHFQFFNFTLQIIISISEVTSEFHFQDYNLNVRSNFKYHTLCRNLHIRSYNFVFKIKIWVWEIKINDLSCDWSQLIDIQVHYQTSNFV